MSEPVSTTGIDWVSIEADFRAGIKAARQIAREQTERGHPVSHTAINKRAREEKWSRDLSAKIRAAADAKVSKAAVSSGVSKEKKAATEAVVVEAGARLQAHIRLTHRAGLTRYWSNIEKLQNKLDQAETPGDGKAVLTILVHATVVKRIGDALAKAVALERQAYGITPDDDGGEGGNDFIARMLNARARAAAR